MSNDLPDWTAPGQPVEVLSTSANNNTATGSFTLPAGAQSMSIITVVQSTDTAHLTLTGATTGFVYYSQELGSSAFELIGCDHKADSVLNYTFQSESGPGCSVHITALQDPPPDFIMRTSAPQDVPTLAKPINVNVPASSSTTLISGVAGRHIRLHYMFLHWQTSTAGFGTFKGDGSTGGLKNYDQKATNFLHHDWKGFALAKGEGFVVENNDTGTGQNLNGSVDYSLD